MDFQMIDARELVIAILAYNNEYNPEGYIEVSEELIGRLAQSMSITKLVEALHNT